MTSPWPRLRDRAEARLKQLAEIESRRSKLIEAESKLQRQLDAAQAQGLAVEERLDAWRREWAAVVVPLGLDPEVPTEQVLELVDQAAELQTRIKEARDTRRGWRDSGARPRNSPATWRTCAGGLRPI